MYSKQTLDVLLTNQKTQSKCVYMDWRCWLFFAVLSSVEVIGWDNNPYQGPPLLTSGNCQANVDR